MKLKDKLKKAFPKLKKGLPKKFDDCIIGVDAEEIRMCYCRDKVAHKLTEIGVKLKGKHTEVNFEEAKDFIWWNMSVSSNYVIVNPIEEM